MRLSNSLSCDGLLAVETLTKIFAYLVIATKVHAQSN